MSQQQALNFESAGPMAFAIPNSYQRLTGLKRWLWAAFVVTAVVLFVTTLWYINALRDNLNANWFRVFIKVAFEWYPWALFAPMISLLVARFPLERTHWIRNLGLHLAVACVIALLQNGSASMGTLVRLPGPITAAAFNKEFVPYLFWMAPWSIAIYFGIAAIVTASDFRTKLVQREWLASKLESELTKAQLNTLYSQLQPHFLFNTLNSISVLMNTGRIDEAQQVLRQLSELLRYVLARGETQLVTVADEVSFVERYLSIEKTRFAERLTYSLEIDPSVRQAQTPTFLLQTLTENAVRHGISPKRDGGRVKIRIDQDNDMLRIRVDDNGVGIGNSENTESAGVGLSNARARLQHLFGNRFQFELTGKPDGGTAALVLIPFQSS